MQLEMLSVGVPCKLVCEITFFESHDPYQHDRPIRQLHECTNVPNKLLGTWSALANHFREKRLLHAQKSP